MTVQLSNILKLPTIPEDAEGREELLATHQALIRQWRELVSQVEEGINAAGVTYTGVAPISVSGSTITTSMATSRLLGRTTASSGVAEEISVGTGLTLASGTISASYAAPTVTSQSADYTAVLADANNCILHPSGDANNRTFTIPANGTVAYPVGTQIEIENEANSVLLKVTTDTLRLEGYTTAPSAIAIQAPGILTLRKTASTAWLAKGKNIGQATTSTDSNISSVVLLALNDGRLGVTDDFYDQSPKARTITSNITTGSPAYPPQYTSVSQAQPTGLRSSMYLAGSQYLSCASSADFAFGTGDYTIEFYAAFTTSNGKYEVIDFRTNGAGEGIVLYQDSTGPNFRALWNSTNKIAATVQTLRTWHHYALTRASATVKMFIDGSQVGSSVTSETTNFGNSVCYLGISSDGATNAMNGCLAGVRVTKGVARYTGTFTPPTLPMPIV